MRSSSCRRAASRRETLGVGFVRRAAGEARLQRFHEIDDLPAGIRHNVGRNVLPVDLALNGLQHALSDGVLVLLGLERLVGRLLDELLRQCELRRLDLALRNRHLRRRANLVGVMELLHRDHAVERAQEDEVLLSACGILSESGSTRLLQRLAKQTIGAVSTLVRAEIVYLLDVLAIDFPEWDELDDLDHPRRFLLERLQLLWREDDVLVLRELVTLDRVFTPNDFVVLRTGVLLFESRTALLVQHVEGDRRLGFRRGVEIDGHRDEPEGNRGGGYRPSRHGRRVREG